MAERVLGFAEALNAVLEQTAIVSPPHSVELVALSGAFERVLARPLHVDRDQPPFDRSTRDGFAVRSAEVGHALRVIGSLKAGQAWSGEPLAADEAVEIMTGAPLPAGADAVAMVEHVTLEGGVLRLLEGRTLRRGENVVPRGVEVRAGAVVLPAGRMLEAAEIAVAASCGYAQVEVFARPKVAIVATGDELVEVGASALAEAQIYNSNSYALAALVRGEGGEALRLPIARDTLADLRARIAEAAGADLLLLSGGVSMGKFDLVEQVLAELGAEFFFTGALIQPGKPVVFGRLASGLYFFGLPGNPVSTQVCFHLFVAPLLRALAGRHDVAVRFVEARLAEDVNGGAKVTRFLPAEMVSAWDGVTVRVVGWEGSGDVAANARGNCYCVLPAAMESFCAGDIVRVLLR